MRRTTVFLPPDLLKRAQQLARREGRSFADVVREAVSTYVAGGSRAGALPSIAGSFGSGASDTSERVDELLWKDPHA